MNLQLINNETFVNQLIDNITSIGVPKTNISAMFLVGSALYLSNPNDVDVKVIVKNYNPKAEVSRNFVINGIKVQAHYYRFRDWARVKDWKVANFIAESEDMILIYGDDSRFVRYDVTTDKANQEYILDIYDKYLFNYNPDNKKTYQFKEKRVWNFMLFYFKVKNASNELTSLQLEELNNVHQNPSIEYCRPFFEELQGLIKWIN